MRQRIMIAMMIALKPDVLIADEPTTALDVTVQQQIMELLGELRETEEMGLILITHDLGVVADVADRIAGDVRRSHVRAGRRRPMPTRTPANPYTLGLLAVDPDGGRARTTGCRPSRASRRAR